MKEIHQRYLQLRQALQNGQDAILATVLQSAGSTPRGAGAKMLVCGDVVYGTIGGGAAEYAARLYAREALQARRSGTREYVLHPNETANLGMVCGGELTVFFQFFSAEDHYALQAVANIIEQCEEQEDSWLVTRILPGGYWESGIYSETTGLLGIGDIMAADLLEYFRHLPGLNADCGCFVEPLVQTGRVYLFGGGHVSRALVPVLAGLEFSLLVFDDRPEFTDAAHFPGAEETCCCPFGNALQGRQINEADCIVIMTRGHQHDFEILTQALTTPASYIGMIGSKSKIANTKKLLLEAGFSENDFARVHTPIGLPIGAETPAEIAVSIAAELIAHRARYYLQTPE